MAARVNRGQKGSELIGEVVGKGLVEFPEGVVHFFDFLFEDFERELKVGLGGMVADLLFLLHFFLVLISQLSFVSFEIGLGDLLVAVESRLQQ